MEVVLIEQFARNSSPRHKDDMAIRPLIALHANIEWWKTTP